MDMLDSRTLIYVSALIDALLTVILICSYRMNKVYPGFAPWTCGYIAKTSGMILLLAGIVYHAAALLLAANILLLAALDLLNRGMRRFVKVEERFPAAQRCFYGAVLTVYSYFLFVQYDTGARIVVFSICTAVQIFQLGLIVWRNLGDDYRSDRLLLSAMAFSVAAVFIFRAALTVTVHLNPLLELDLHNYQSWIYPYSFCMSIAATILFLDCNVRRQFLENAASQSKIRVLEGLLHVCCSCNKVHDVNSNSWQQMETYIARHSEADFSHGFCPECFDKAMKEISEYRNENHQVHEQPAKAAV
jgi:hypothetical protein